MTRRRKAIELISLLAVNFRKYGTEFYYPTLDFNYLEVCFGCEDFSVIEDLSKAIKNRKFFGFVTHGENGFLSWKKQEILLYLFIIHS